jgi:protein subunit release factor A
MAIPVEDFDVTVERAHSAGGQHVGMDAGIMVVTHRETGVKIIIPPHCGRSQHKRRLIAMEALEYVLLSV